MKSESSFGLGVFLRAPRLGTVKTRLARDVGAAAALAAYQRLLARTLDAIASLPCVDLCGTPDDALPELEPWRRPGWTLSPQGPGNLGDRLHRAFARWLGAPHARWVVIGTDCPELTPGDIQAAWQALDQAEVVLGPATDGGYWLLGLKAPAPDLFREIPWGGPEVLQMTRDRAASLGRRVALLRELRDVDTAADWQAFQSREPFPEPSKELC
ncbi:MAG: TIGR04282 family arsenosugar biosynthesis glycosyltransferase [Verrucomicrobiae bacterium]|nr:TIGR04282 family arsenosugar biosynthesis glycosyltransferase [Verrucomicrobiae bacterium]